MLIPSEEKRHRNKHRSRSRSDESPTTREVRRSHRSRSRSPPTKLNRNEEDLEELVMERERALAAASRKEDVAKRPASYKSALSLSLPVGTTRS